MLNVAELKAVEVELLPEVRASLYVPVEDGVYVTVHTVADDNDFVAVLVLVTSSEVVEEVG